MKEARNAYDTQHKLHTFSVGVPNSPDLIAARKVQTGSLSNCCILWRQLQASVDSTTALSASCLCRILQVAEFLGTIHHEFTFTVQEGLDALEDLIWHIESFEQVRRRLDKLYGSSCCTSGDRPLTAQLKVSDLPHSTFWRYLNVCHLFDKRVIHTSEIERTHAGAGSGANVHPDAEDQGDGHQGGAVGGGRRRGARRLPVLPQGAQRCGVPHVSSSLCDPLSEMGSGCRILEGQLCSCYNPSCADLQAKHYRAVAAWRIADLVICICRETVRLLKRLHQWDVLRANKAPFAWGVETRVPFLDKAFLDLVMNIDPQEKMVGFPAAAKRATSQPDCIVAHPCFKV